MATDITTRPQYLNANNLVYSFWDLRRYMDNDPPGPGVANYESFRVLPRQAGVNLSVDVGKTSPGLMEAWVRGSTRGGQGLYRVDNIDVTAPTADTYLAQLNVAVTSNASGNPRLDQVVLVIGDAQHAGANNKAYLDVIAGTPTGGATLDNRTGAAALPASSILLADILLASGDATVDAVDIRDRRPFPLFGTIPPALNGAVDMVAPIPEPSLAYASLSITTAFNNNQIAALFYIPRRIAGATRIRWRYGQLGTALTGNYNFGIYDASARLIVSTGVVAFTGALNTVQNRSETIAATTFEPGWYYVVLGFASLAAGSINIAGYTSVVNTGTGLVIPTGAGIGLTAPSGGTTLLNFLTGFTDFGSGTGTVATVGIPAIKLSVG